MSTDKDLQGEGNYEASEEDAQELDRAEERGKSHLAEEGPQLRD